jgi:hypothetical protein
MSSQFQDDNMRAFDHGDADILRIIDKCFGNFLDKMFQGNAPVQPGRFRHKQGDRPDGET